MLTELCQQDADASQGNHHIKNLYSVAIHFKPLLSELQMLRTSNMPQPKNESA